MALAARRPLLMLAAAGTAVAALALNAGTALAVPVSTPAPSCSSSAYAYAGLYSNAPAAGIEANVTALAIADVPYGHVAAWIGIGVMNAGPSGQAEWLQAGLATSAGLGGQLYAEITQPGLPPRYLTLASGVTAGTAYQLAVVRVAGRADSWRVLVDGIPATAPVSLPGSSAFAPMAMSESWNGGEPDCNGFSYRFDRLRIANAQGQWAPLTNTSTLADDGYQVIDRSTAGFTALSA